MGRHEHAQEHGDDRGWKQCQSGHLQKTVADGDSRRYFVFATATTVGRASPRLDWNGRLRITSRTSVWNP